MRTQFKGELTDVNIRSAIDRRKQKENESYDEFYESIVLLADKLSVLLSELALLEILRANLQPHELLYEKIISPAHLRHLVRKREVFIQCVAKNKPLFQRPQAPVRRVVNAVEQQVSCEEVFSEDDESMEVAALNLVCWNCRENGHRYQNCTIEHRVFCYGCGQPNTYKNSCTKCTGSKNLGTRAPVVSARKKLSSIATQTDL